MSFLITFCLYVLSLQKGSNVVFWPCDFIKSNDIDQEKYSTNSAPEWLQIKDDRCVDIDHSI